ncbi:unnamed protein product [Dovyalis caffra]|uniref:Uncharacterized protein n=1 Tax=Dovyalis caffra TaxID=77055 RepID=A0AAV1QUH0_9ROSI|nr:unnamed protein product [Dovyalis caffra]
MRGGRIVRYLAEHRQLCYQKPPPVNILLPEAVNESAKEQRGPIDELHPTINTHSYYHKDYWMEYIVLL